MQRTQSALSVSKRLLFIAISSSTQAVCITKDIPVEHKDELSKWRTSCLAERVYLAYLAYCLVSRCSAIFKLMSGVVDAFWALFDVIKLKSQYLNLNL